MSREQVMLKQDSGELACVAERPKRYTLNEVKEVLLDVVRASPRRNLESILCSVSLSPVEQAKAPMTVVMLQSYLHVCVMHRRAWYYGGRQTRKPRCLVCEHVHSPGNLAFEHVSRVTRSSWLTC